MIGLLQAIGVSTDPSLIRTFPGACGLSSLLEEVRTLPGGCAQSLVGVYTPWSMRTLPCHCTLSLVDACGLSFFRNEVQTLPGQ